MNKDELNKLANPIDPIKWRVQSIKDYGEGFAICVPYIDSRDVQKRLDDVCGIADWQSRYKEVKGNLFCEIGIFIDSEWIWKSDVGTESNIEKTKGESSDSFKRAAVMWGVGRFLYDIEPLKIPATSYKNKKYPAYKDNGQLKPIFEGLILSRYCNSVSKKKQVNNV